MFNFLSTKFLIIICSVALALTFLDKIPEPFLVEGVETEGLESSGNDPVSNIQGLQTQKFTSETVPELKEILSPNQEIRLTATRKLVERVDVEEALEILEYSDLPHTGEGHLAVHQIGFFAYKKYGVESILKCKDYFLYACYHGAIIEAASDQGFEAISKMADKCKESPLRYFQCAHAAGHSILAIWNYDLPSALTTCDEIFGKETQFPESLSSCHNGAFMENLFGVHDWGSNQGKERAWLSEDPYYPCNAFAENYQKGCWLNQAARIYQMYNGDIEKTAKACKETGSEQYTIWCMDNLARQIHPLTQGDINIAFELCPKEGVEWINNCLTVNAGSFYSVGDPNSAIGICKRINPEGKEACYQNIIGQIRSDMLPIDKKQELCNKLDEPSRSICLQQLY